MSPNLLPSPARPLAGYSNEQLMLDLATLTVQGNPDPALMADYHAEADARTAEGDPYWLSRQGSGK